MLIFSQIPNMHTLQNKIQNNVIIYHRIASFQMKQCMHSFIATLLWLAEIVLLVQWENKKQEIHATTSCGPNIGCRPNLCISFLVWLLGEDFQQFCLLNSRKASKQFMIWKLIKNSFLVGHIFLDQGLDKFRENKMPSVWRSHKLWVTTRNYMSWLRFLLWLWLLLFIIIIALETRFYLDDAIPCVMLPSPQPHHRLQIQTLCAEHCSLFLLDFCCLILGSGVNVTLRRTERLLLSVIR